MDTFNLIFFLAFLLGLSAIIWFMLRNRFKEWKSKKDIDHHIVLNRIEKVFKLVLAEGFFSEIVDFKHEGKKLFGLLSSTKKSIFIVDATVMIGFDFKKAKIEIDQVNNKIRFTHIPPPEILSMETDFKFYDINNGMFNKFKTDDYTELLKAGKDHIKEKVMDSELIEAATAQLQILIEQISDNSGYTIDNTKKLIENNE